MHVKEAIHGLARTSMEPKVGLIRSLIMKTRVFWDLIRPYKWSKAQVRPPWISIWEHKKAILRKTLCKFYQRYTCILLNITSKSILNGECSVYSCLSNAPASSITDCISHLEVCDFARFMRFLLQFWKSFFLWTECAFGYTAHIWLAKTIYLSEISENQRHPLTHSAKQLSKT